MMNHKTTLKIVMLGLLLSQGVQAVVSVPNTFSTSTIISSSQVNANFTALVTAFNALIGNTAGTVMAADSVPNCLTNEKLEMSSGPTFTWSCVADNATDPTKLPLAGGALTGALDMGSFSITNLSAPAGANDAATKSYVDSSQPWLVSGGLYYTGSVAVGSNSADANARFYSKLLLSSATTNQQAIRSLAENDTYAISTLEGGSFTAINSIIGTTNALIGASATVTNTGGTVMNAKGLVGSISENPNSITNGYAIYAKTPTSGASAISNLYGLFLEMPTAGVNTYAIYSAGAHNSFLNGNLGIKTTTPAYALDVTGDIRTSGCLYYNASSLGTCASDARLKNAVKPFTMGLRELEGINPVHFKYNGKGGFKEKNIQLGVIAQEVEKTAPELIVKMKIKMNPADKEMTEVKGVNYSSFIYVLINSVKELSLNLLDNDNEVENLKMENLKLKTYLCEKDPAAPFC